MEKLYTIPVSDAFKTDCECPVCSLYKDLEDKSIEFVMGPSYMEDDVRMETNRTGFCGRHIKMMYVNQNRLGLALMLKTHMDRVIDDIESLTGSDKPEAMGFFEKIKAGKKGAPAPQPPAEGSVSAYIDRVNESCYVCDRIARIFDRYIATIFHMYKTDESFRKMLKEGKGLCIKHYGDLRSEAPKYLSQGQLDGFVKDLDVAFVAGMKRVRDDLDWFTDKFDYRNANAPWKNSQDALPRSVLKVDSETLE